MPPNTRAPKSKTTESYLHPEADSPMRPDVGTQAQFKKRKPPQTYRYDSSLSPALDWDGQNSARERGEVLLAALVEKLATLRAALADDPENATLRANVDECQ